MLHVDYMFWNADGLQQALEDENYQKSSTAVDTSSGYAFGIVVITKGVWPCIVESMARWIVSLGYETITLPSPPWLVRFWFEADLIDARQGSRHATTRSPMVRWKT